MYKKTICYLLVLFLVSVIFAKSGDKMYINVEKAVLKEGTNFFSSETGKLPYGSQVIVLAENGKWVQVVSTENKN